MGHVLEQLREWYLSFQNREKMEKYKLGPSKRSTKVVACRSPLYSLLYGNRFQILSGIKKNENEISLESIRNLGICVRNLC